MKSGQLLIIALCVGWVAFCAVVWLTWERIPWWRAKPTPRRQYDDDKDHLKQWRIRRRHKRAFADSPLPPPRTTDG